MFTYTTIVFVIVMWLFKFINEYLIIMFNIILSVIHIYVIL